MIAKWSFKSLTAILWLLFASNIWAIALAADTGGVGPISEVEGSMVIEPKVERINPGINPEFFGYRIEGLVLKGANDCMAMGVAVEIHSYIDQGALYLLPVRANKSDIERVCPSFSQPIYELAHIDVRYSRKEIRKIIIRNVGDDLEDFAFVP